MFYVDLDLGQAFSGVAETEDREEMSGHNPHGVACLAGAPDANCEEQAQEAPQQCSQEDGHSGDSCHPFLRRHIGAGAD